MSLCCLHHVLIGLWQTVNETSYSFLLATAPWRPEMWHYNFFFLWTDPPIWVVNLGPLVTVDFMAVSVIKHPLSCLSLYIDSPVLLVSQFEYSLLNFWRINKIKTVPTAFYLTCLLCSSVFKTLHVHYCSQSSFWGFNRNAVFSSAMVLNSIYHWPNLGVSKERGWM